MFIKYHLSWAFQNPLFADRQYALLSICAWSDWGLEGGLR